MFIYFCVFEHRDTSVDSHHCLNMNDESNDSSSMKRSVVSYIWLSSVTNWLVRVDVEIYSVSNSVISEWNTLSELPGFKITVSIIWDIHSTDVIIFYRSFLLQVKYIYLMKFYFWNFFLSYFAFLWYLCCCWYLLTASSCQVSAPVLTSQCINLQHVDWNHRGIDTYCRYWIFKFFFVYCY